MKDHMNPKCPLGGPIRSQPSVFLKHTKRVCCWCHVDAPEASHGLQCTIGQQAIYVLNAVTGHMLISFARGMKRTAEKEKKAQFCIFIVRCRETASCHSSSRTIKTNPNTDDR